MSTTLDPSTSLPGPPAFDSSLRRPGESAFLEFVLENFVRTNPLFLFSAGALLLGAWLLNPPGGDGARSLPLLVQLFVVVQVYEFALLGASALLARNSSGRDLRNLLLVLGPFLLDVTFTSSSLSALVAQELGLVPALGLVALTLFAAWIKLRVGLRLSRETLSARAVAALALGPVLVGLTPLIGLVLARHGLAPLTGLVTGAGLALLVACLASCSTEETLRRLAPLAALGVTVHALSTAWVYASPLAWTLAPSLLVLGVLAPRIWPGLAVFQRALAVSLPAAGVVLGAEWGGVSAAQWRPLLAAAGLVQIVALRRDRAAFVHWLALALAADLAIGGSTAAESLQSLGATPLEPLLVLGASGVALARNLAPKWTLALAALALGLTTQQVDFAPHLEATFVLQGLGLMTWLCGMRIERAGPSTRSSRSLRLAGALTLGCAPAAALTWLPADEVLAALTQSTGLALLLAALALRSGLLASASLPAACDLAGRLAPQSATAWGVAFLLGAFALVGGGVILSLRREQLLALLRARAQQPRVLRQETCALAFAVVALAFALPAGL